MQQIILDELRSLRKRRHDSFKKRLISPIGLRRDVCQNNVRNIFGRKRSRKCKLHELARWKQSKGELQFIFCNPPEDYTTFQEQHKTLYSIIRFSIGIYDALSLLNLVPSHQSQTITPPKYSKNEVLNAPIGRVIEPDYRF